MEPRPGKHPRPHPGPPPLAPGSSRGRDCWSGALAPLLLAAFCQLATAAPALCGGASGVPSASSQAALRQEAALRNQAIQAMQRGDLRRGCPLLRRAIDQTGALLARKPSPALEAELRGLLQRLQPCLRKGL
ncbi:MAG: hypothetical protein ACK52U_16885 [Synechococcaceae cyanobacterium]